MKKNGCRKGACFFMAAKTLFHIIDSTGKVVSNSKKRNRNKIHPKKGEFYGD